MKKYLLFASALLAFASCANDNYLGTEDEQRFAQGEKPITFGFDVPAATRAEVKGATAAGKLNNQFVVYSQKNESAGAAPTDGNLVIKNYQVKWTTGSDFSTTSNTTGWEYVGFASAFSSGVIPVSTEVQTIKYWDYSASNYVFTAVSALPADIEGSKVTITKVESGSNKYAKGYTVALNKADISQLYFADRVEITKPTSATAPNRMADNVYGGKVKFTFRNAQSQVRVGMYETIPGYVVKAVKFYKNDGSTEMVDASSNKVCGTIVPNIPSADFVGTLNVSYYDNTTDTENQPKITVSPSGSAATELILGNNIQTTLSGSNYLATAANNPTWDKTGGAFTAVFPQIGNTTNMVLKVDYTLYNETTKETIEVKGASATVPGKYVAWKPNFKYTYLFKISDNTNGTTDPTVGPVGLWPITFDAVVVEAEDGQAEYITTVSEPSITTFGVDSEGKYLVNGNEYANGNDIYATIMDGASAVDPTSATINIYKNITAATGFTVTEASLAEAIQEISAKNHKISYTLDNSIKSNVTTVPGEDGNDITINAIKLDKTKLTAGTYAIEYVKAPATYKFVVVPIAESAFDATKAELNLYTAADDGAPLGSSATFSSTATYYKKVVDNPGVYAYKVIKVQ